MAGPGWHDDNITGADFELMPILAAQHQFGVAARETKHFMRRGVIVVKVVNAVTPLWRPTVKLEPRFEVSGGVAELHQKLRSGRAELADVRCSASSRSGKDGLALAELFWLLVSYRSF
jgi:hypothetical protein